MAVMGGEASARAKDTAPIPIIISDSSDDSHDGVLGPAVQADGVRDRRRHCQQPGTNSGSASGTRRHASIAPHGTCPGANQMRPPPKTTSRPTQVPREQSVEDPPPEMSPPGEPTACGKCGDALLAHMRVAAGKLSSRLRVHERRVMDLLQLWWHTALLRIWDRPLAPEVKRADLQLLHEVPHELAVNGPPEDASSPVLAGGRKVLVQLAAKGLGNAGSVQVPPTLWEQWADPCFEWAGRNAPTQPHSRCPKAQALLTALERQGLVEGRGEAPNASVFVKWKSEAMAALILNMKAFNHTCAYKARRFRLPTLEGPADRCVQWGGGGRQKLT